MDSDEKIVHRHHEDGHNGHLPQDGKWWFYDETGLEYGPFETEEIAKAELEKYMAILG